MNKVGKIQGESKKIYYLLLIASIAVIVVIVIAEAIYARDSLYFKGDGAGAFHSDWQYDYNRGAADQMFFAENALPDDLEKDAVISIIAGHAKVCVYIDQKPVYRYGFEKAGLPANMCHLIDLPEESAGKSVIIGASVDHFFGEKKPTLTGITIGNRTDSVMESMKPALIILMVSGMIIMLGVAFIVIALIFKRREISEQYAATLYFGLFMLFTSVWLLSSSLIVQLITGKELLLHSIALVSCVLLFVFLLLYIRENISFARKSVSVLCFLLLLSLLGTGLTYWLCPEWLQACPHFNFLLMGVSVLVVTVFCAVEAYRYRNKKIFSLQIGTTILSCAVVGGALLLFLGRSDYALPVKFAVVMVVLIELLRMTSKIFVLEKNYTQIQEYKMLAYQDYMTGLQNRTAFNLALERTEALKGKNAFVCLMIFDLDDLKAVNDAYGHSAGDRMIEAFSDCLKSVFRETEMRFRIGGDEFAVILTGQKLKNIDFYINKLKTLAAKQKIGNNVALTFSWGHAVHLFASNKVFDMETLFVQADEAMYKRKREKAKTLNESER